MPFRKGRLPCDTTPLFGTNFNKINKLYAGISFALIMNGSDSSYALSDDGGFLGR